jgi:hypothetical protein
MKEQQQLSPKTEAKTQRGENPIESLHKERAMEFAENLNLVLTKELAMYLQYGEDNEFLEEEIPQWIQGLPQGKLIQRSK